MERVFGTLEPSAAGAAPAGIGLIEAASRFLAEAFVAEHNARFAVTAAEPGSAFVAYAGELAEVLCVQVERVVGNDNCVRYDGPLPADPVATPPPPLPPGATTSSR